MKTRYKISLAVLCIALVLVAAYLFARPAAAPASSENPSGALAAAYPLYITGLTWSIAENVSLPPHSDYNPTASTITGMQVTSLPTATTDNIAALTAPFRTYYDKSLLNQGWKIDPMYEADGAGGSLWGYTKGSQVLIFSYASTFLNQQQGTPEQCPCTIVFTIIGGTLK